MISPKICFTTHFGGSSESPALYRKFNVDRRITSWHISLYLSILFCWQESGSGNIVRISRKELMKAARIGSATTYHKCLRDLCAYGYIRYCPTYDSYAGSTIEVLL